MYTCSAIKSEKTGVFTIKIQHYSRWQLLSGEDGPQESTKVRIAGIVVHGIFKAVIEDALQP